MKTLQYDEVKKYFTMNSKANLQSVALVSYKTRPPT